MGTQGVPTTVTSKILSDAIKRRRGVAAKVQDDLNISHTEFYRLLERYKLKELLHQERNAYSERMCDVAEDVLLKGMLQTEEIGSALGAAKYVLNNKGRNRGYYPPVIPPEPKDEVVNDIRTGIKTLSEESRSEGTIKSILASEPSLPDS